MVGMKASLQMTPSLLRCFLSGFEFMGLEFMTNAAVPYHGALSLLREQSHTK